MPIDVFSASFDDSYIYLHHRIDGERKVKQVQAPWSLFVKGANKDAIQSSIPRYLVSRIESQGDYVRIDCDGRNARYRVRDSLARLHGNDAIREADIDPILRFFADNPQFKVSTSPIIGYLDLEVQSPGMGIDDARAGKSRILSYAARSSTGRERAEVLAENDPRRGNDIPVEELDRMERKMILRLIEFLFHCDVIVAYFGGGHMKGTGFDFDALRHRCEVLNLKMEDIVPENGSWLMWAWLDHMEVIKKYGSGEGEDKESMALDHVARSHGIEGKRDFNAANVWDVWESGPAGRKRVLEYNIQDTAILPQLESKTGYLNLHFSASHMCGLIPHTAALKATKQADGYLIPFAARDGYRWPTRWEPEDEEPAPGAFVFEVKEPGLHEHVNVADFGALYPSIIVTWNIGPDTVVMDPKTVAKGTPLTKTPLEKIWFRNDSPGYFKRAVIDIIRLRKEYQAERDKYEYGSSEYSRFAALDSAAKIILNSFYGVLLCKWSRFYSREAGTAVTSNGQWLIQTVASEIDASGYGFRTVGGDTDSVFVECPADPITCIDSPELFTETGRLFQSVVENINAGWAPKLLKYGCQEHRIDLDWEQTLRRMVILKKKMYFGTSHYFKGKRPKTPWKHKIRGLAMRRGDRIRPARRMQAEIVEKIIGHEDNPVLPDIPDTDHMKTWVQLWRTQIIDSTPVIEDVRITQGLSRTLAAYQHTKFTSKKCKRCNHEFADQEADGVAICECGLPRKRYAPPNHVKVAILMEERGEGPLVGDRIPYVIVYDPVQKKGIPVHVDELRDIGDVDKGYYWGATYSPSYAILQAVWSQETWIDPKKDAEAVRKLVRQHHYEVAAESSGLMNLLNFLPEESSVDSPVVTIVVDGDAHQDKITTLKTVLERCPGDSCFNIEIKHTDYTHTLRYEHPRISKDFLVLRNEMEMIDEYTFRFK